MNGQMESKQTATGKKVRFQAKELRHGLMVPHTLESMKTTERKVKERRLGQMD